MSNKYYVFDRDTVLLKGLGGTIRELDLSKRSENHLHLLWREVIEDQCYIQHGFDVDTGDVVVDVGANIGLFSRYALSRGASIVHSIEPHPTAFNCLVLNNGKCVNFHPHKFAVTDTVGLMNIHVGGCFSNDYYFMADTITPFNDDSGSYEIASVSVNMDSLFECGMFRKIDFLKIDIEGAEVSLFDGLSDENLKTIDKIAIEMHPRFHPIGMNELKGRLGTFFDRVSWSGYAGQLENFKYRRKRDVG